MKKNNSHSGLPPKEELQNFKVPEGYFAQNAVQLKQIAKEVQQERPKTKVIQLMPLITWLSAAAVVTLVLFGVVNRNQSTSDVLTDEELYALVDVGYVSYSNYELALELEIEDDLWLDLDEQDAQDYLESSDLYYIEESLLYDTY